MSGEQLNLALGKALGNSKFLALPSKAVLHSSHQPVLEVGQVISGGGDGGLKGTRETGVLSPVFQGHHPLPSQPQPQPSPVLSAALIRNWVLSRHCLPSMARCPLRSGVCRAGCSGWGGRGPVGEAPTFQGPPKAWLS